MYCDQERYLGESNMPRFARLQSESYADDGGQSLARVRGALDLLNAMYKGQIGSHKSWVAGRRVGRSSNLTVNTARACRSRHQSSAATQSLCWPLSESLDPRSSSWMPTR